MAFYNLMFNRCQPAKEIETSNDLSLYPAECITWQDTLNVRPALKEAESLTGRASCDILPRERGLDLLAPA